MQKNIIIYIFIVFIGCGIFSGCKSNEPENIYSYGESTEQTDGAVSELMGKQATSSGAIQELTDNSEQLEGTVEIADNQVTELTVTLGEGEDNYTEFIRIIQQIKTRELKGNYEINE